MQIGDMFYYKKTAGRGRPFVGTLKKKMGAIVEMENKVTGEIMRVQTRFVGKPYEFKPYNKKAA